ncbi:MAG: peroxiredoxin [Acidimicrobiales bacterium]
MIEIGQPAPDFTLNGTDKAPHTLSELAGTPVLLVFYPFTFTGICEGELCRLRDDYAQFEDKGVHVLALSCDTAPAQAKWAEEQGWTFPVLSDFWPHGAVAQAYGVFNEERGCANRSTILVGADGTVVDAFGTDSLGTPREADRYAEALAKL